MKIILKDKFLKTKVFFTKGNPRSILLKKNIAISFILKGISIIISVIRIPIVLSYLDIEKYGVWLTIASILDWINIFDLGLGHGLRNRFTEAIALKDEKRAKGLVSTAYISMSAIMICISLLIIPIILFLDWNKILNTTLISQSELKYTVLLVTLIFIARLVLKLVSSLLKALQQPALSDVFLPVSSIISLVLIIVLKIFILDSLFWACAIIAIPQVIVLFIANIIFFNAKYSKFSPSIKSYSRIYLRDIYSLGSKFFIGQILGLVLLSSSNIILTQAINPQEVTIYNIAKKYFSLPIAYYMIIVAPYWSAVTDAYYKNEFHWIKTQMKNLSKITLLFCGGLLLMLSLSIFAYHFWIGDKVVIPLQLSIMFTIYNMGVVILAPYSIFRSGFGKLKLGTIVAPFKMVLYLPTAWFLAKSYGAFGMVLALFLVHLLPNFYINIRQYYLIVSQKSVGIWNQ